MKDRTGAEYPTNRPTTRPAPPAPPNLAAPISEGAGPLLAPGGGRLPGLAPRVSRPTGGLGAGRLANPPLPAPPAITVVEPPLWPLPLAKVEV